MEKDSLFFANDDTRKGKLAKQKTCVSKNPQGGNVTSGKVAIGNRGVIDICSGCGSSIAEIGVVTVFCDEKGYPAELVRLCVDCANLLATGSAEDRIEMFDRIGEVESAFFVCPIIEKRMASN